MEWLVNYAWPGNIRELQNVIERAVVVCQGSLLSLGRDLISLPAGGGHSATHEMEPSGLASPQTSGPRPAVHVTGAAQPTLQEVARSHILAVLKQTGGVIEGPKGAATVLNVHPNTLRSRMKKLGIRYRSGTVDS